MSMHKIPVTSIEEAGLRAHGLPVGTPSQLSDVFRQGMAWALQQQPAPSVPEEWRTDDPQIGELILVKRTDHYLPFVGEFRTMPYRSCINRGTGKWVGFSEWVPLSRLIPSAATKDSGV